MSNLDFIVFDEKGQACFNFDAIELVTSEKFVSRIKFDLLDGYEYLFHNVNFLSDGSCLFAVYLHKENEFFRIHRSLGDVCYDIGHIGMFDIGFILESLGGSIQWLK